MMRLVGDGDSLETTWNHRPASDFLPEDELGRKDGVCWVGWWEGTSAEPQERAGSAPCVPRVQMTQL